MVGISSAAQKWDFDNDDKMYKGAHVETGTVTIGQGESNIWKAQYDAEVDVGFSAALWVGALKCSTPADTKKFKVSIGKSDGTTFTPYKTSSEVTFDSTEKEYDFNAPAFTVPTNEWLACKVENTGSASFTLVTDDGTCFVTYEHDTPAYPVPELPTIILTSTGLLALAGYVLLRKRF